VTPRRTWILLALGLLAASLACGEPPGAEPAPRRPVDQVVAKLRLAGVPFDAPQAKPDFALRDTRGRPFDFRRDTQGVLTLLFFGYTHCPDVCPVHLANIASALATEPQIRDRVKVVFVAVDPQRDTPERVREWLDRFDHHFIGLVGTPEEVRQAQVAAGVPPATVGARWEGGYAVDHAAWVVLYTADGWGRLRYPFGTRQREWAHDLAILATDGWPAA
jgi:protein SCO1/2